MSSHEQAILSLLSQLALSLDGAVLGLALAYAAVRSVLKFTNNSTAVRKIRDAPSVSVSDLRSLLADTDTDADGNSDDGKVVFVRGTVDAKSAVDGSWKTLRPSVLVSRESGDKGVVLQRTQTCIYNEWKGLFGWPSDLRTIFARTWKQEVPRSLRKVPFVLIDVGRRSNTEYVVVDLEGSSHPLPLTTIYHRLQPINASPYTLLQALFGHEFPVGLLDEEKILPLGKDISAVGICSLRNGIPEIKSCKDLPYFLWQTIAEKHPLFSCYFAINRYTSQIGHSGWQKFCHHSPPWPLFDKTGHIVLGSSSDLFLLRSELSKDQMVVDLAFKTKVLFWSGIILSSMSVGILGYAVVRNWNRLMQWKQQRQHQQERQTVNDADPHLDDDEIEDLPDGQLCVVCLRRRRRSVFVPCGHLVCCQGCAISIERVVAPKCPVCRQEIRNSVRIFES